MKRSRRRWRRAAQIVGAAAGLTGSSALAGTTYFNPGLLASWTFGKQGGFGLGTEISVMHQPYGASGGPFDLPVSHGAFLQVEKLWGGGRDFRAAAGGQASPSLFPVAGGELGLFLQHDSRGWASGVHGGLWGSAAGVIGLSLRGNFEWPAGLLHPAIALTVKAPIGIGGYGCPPFVCVDGRPLRVEGGYLLPEIAEPGGTEFLALPGTLARVGSAEQEALAAKWLLAARGEYASIPSFLQLASELEDVGAPDSIIDAALTAAEDEVRHARTSFALASAYAEVPRRPALGLPLAPSRRAPQERHLELARLAAESWLDGCVGEGLAAARAQHAASTVDDPLVASIQATIAREEATHAELGWGIVRWCLHEGGETVRRALVEAQDQVADAGGAEEARARLQPLLAAA